MAVTQSAPALVASKPSASKYDPQQDFVEEVVIPFDDEDPADSSDYSYDENIPAPESEPKLEPAAEVNEPFDLSDALAQTSIQLKRLGWNNQLSSQILGGDLWLALALAF